MNSNLRHTPPGHSKRLAAERRFRRLGQAALLTAVVMLIILLGSITARGYGAFMKSEIRLNVAFDAAQLGLEPGHEVSDISASSYAKLVQEALKAQFPEATERSDQRALFLLASSTAGDTLHRLLIEHPGWLGSTQRLWLPATSNADLFFKGKMSEAVPEADRKLNDKQIGWLKTLSAHKDVRKVFNTGFFTDGDSRTAEQAGFLGAMAGSGLTLIVCLLVVFPLGVMTAVYLEEFAKKSRLVDIIEININNLAAVPSIVFGLLGLAVYINMMGMPRGASLVGGLTLALMILPVIIITTRASLKAIPDSIRDAARALGATPLQVVWHHTLPLAMPGVMTGTILGMARAIGETAPLLMIGMVAFVADTPGGFTAPATVMPVQIYLWADNPEAGYAEKTAAGILVLIVLLLAMNALAIFLRKKFEVRW